MVKKHWLSALLIVSFVLVLWLIYFPLLQYPRPIKGDTTKLIAPVIHYAVIDTGTTKILSDTFLKSLQTTLTNPKGWSRAGVSFQKVNSGPDVTYILESGARIQAASPSCDSYYNCTVGNKILVNDDRWLNGDGWHGSIQDYHALIINHETGHFLGLNHWTCLCAFEPAPVMMTHQNTTAFHVWRPNAWPTTQEVKAAKGHLL